MNQAIRASAASIVLLAALSCSGGSEPGSAAGGASEMGNGGNATGGASETLGGMSGKSSSGGGGATSASGGMTTGGREAAGSGGQMVDERGGATSGGFSTGGQHLEGGTGNRAGAGGVGGTGHGGSSGAAGKNDGGTGGVARSACPNSAPSIADSCAAEGLDCSWGESAFPECRTHLVCAQGKWGKGLTLGACRSTSAGVCPVDAAEKGSGCPAGNVGAGCSYASGSLCTCQSQVCGGTGCTPLSSPTWICSQPPTGCPTLAPNAGAACDGNRTCMYEYCGLTAMCRDGKWLWQFGCA